MTLTSVDYELLLQANRILSSKLDVKEVLATVMELATRVVHAEASGLLLLDAKTNELYFDVALGEAGKEVKQIRLKVGEGIAGWVAANKMPTIVNDVRSDSRWSGKADEKTDFVTKAILAVPLLAKGQLIGVVEAINKEDGSDFTEEDQKIFEAFASQAAVAIENARLFGSIREEKEKLSTVFSDMSDGALLLDELGHIKMMNGAAGTLLGTEPGKAIGHVTIRQLFDSFEVTPPLEDFITRQVKAAPVELDRKTPPGKTLYLSGVINRLVSEQQDLVGYLVIFRDVTAEKKEGILKRNFLSLMSHKLKTPLVAITGYAPLLLEDEQLSNFQKKSLTAIKQQGDNLAKLVEKLLSFTLVESENLTLEKKPFCVKQLVSDALATLKTYIQERPVQIEEDGVLEVQPDVLIDPDRTREVLKNILENAIKFNPNSDRKVKISAEKRLGYVCISVADNGPGIPPEEKTKIFQKFYQIEESFTGQVEGAGLGLALAIRIVEDQGGSIEVESTLGSGSTFSFTLPIVREVTEG